VKLGNAAADDMDKGKEKHQCWIKKKINTASTRGVVMLMEVTNAKQESSKPKVAQVFAFKPSTLSPSLWFTSFLVRALPKF